MNNPELKPCPFCGGVPYLANVAMAGCSYVVCTDCRMQSDDGSRNRVVNKWNTRAAPKVKPLVWSQTTDTKKYGFPRRRWRGLAGLGVQYVIWDYDRSEADRVDGWFLVGGLSTFILGSRHDTLNHAKAAAQADYDRRILDALE